MEHSPPETLSGLTAADVMVASPKTLDADVRVATAREALAADHVQMLLLTDGRRLRGAVTSIPEQADQAAPALDYADRAPETIEPTESAEVAYERASLSPHRRVVVLGSNDELLGLVCLNSTLTRFCSGGGGRPEPRP